MQKPTFKPNDIHLVVTDKDQSPTSLMNCFSASGKLLWSRPCLAKGQTSNYKVVKGDTPPGVYKLAYHTETQDYENQAIWHSFGKHFFDMGSVSGAEEKYGRSGVGIHGGGSNAPDPLAPFQLLCATHGCIRMYNSDVEKLLLPLWEQTQKNGGIIYVTVDQR